MDRDFSELKRTTVGDLIKALKELPADSFIFVNGYEGGYHDCPLPARLEKIMLNVNDEWYYGPHEDVSSSQYLGLRDTHPVLENVYVLSR
jgi:hypothetical protein